jgi:hypothetical protein
MESSFQIIKSCILILLFFTNCTKELKIDEVHSDQQLVVEGYIEPNKYPLVYLTKSSAYFNKIDSSNILEYIASYAKVSVSVEGKTEVLTLKRYNDNRYPIFYYEGNEIKGEIGKIYTLKIELSGKVYESSTIISETTSLNTLNYFNATNNPEQKFLKINFKDPANKANYYRIYTKRYGKDADFIPCYLSTFSDFDSDGKEINFEIIRSFSPIISTDNGRYFVTGDSVIIKFCSIDKTQYTYWKAIESQIAISSNPFGLSSNTPVSLISNNALGVWSGLSSNYYHIKIK